MSMREIVNFHINPRGYKYGTHYLPHDATHHEYSIGGNTLDRAKEYGLNVIALKIASISSGIEKYNKSLGMFTSEPEHDEHSHCADAFRYLAMSDAIVSNISTPKKTITRSMR